MYLSNYYCLPTEKEANKCSKIFRPWDFHEEQGGSSVKVEDAQDATISTTTDFEDASRCSEDISERKVKEVCRLSDESKSFIANVGDKVQGGKCEYNFKSREEFTASSCPSRAIKDEAPIKHRKVPDAPVNKIQESAASGIGFRKPERTTQIPLVEEHSGRSKESLKSLQNLPGLQDYPATVERYPLYPEMLHANLAQTLGLPPSDPLVLESMAQGYALEEYARVLSQEHQAKLLSSRKQRPKKYRCPHCDVGFSNNGQLKGHIRIHTGERPFKCDEKNCGKTFTRNEELTRHKRIHSGLRPFPCTHCGKRFGRKDHLKKHSRTHLQPRGLYAVPVMLPFDSWTAATSSYPFVPMFGY